MLTAHYVQRLPRKKPILVRASLVSERLPVLVLALSAFVLPSRSAPLAVGVFFAAYTWHCIGAGLVAVAWQDLVAKVTPVQYRGRLLGISNFGGTASRILGASLVAAILARRPFPASFAICFGLAFASMMLSWLSLTLIREAPLAPSSPPVSFAQYWRRLPALLRSDPNFVWYLTARVLTVLGRMGVGFLTVYSVERWRLTDSQASVFTVVLLVGQALATLIFGTLADRRGHKIVLEISLGLSAASMLLAVVAPSPRWMWGVFAFIGAITASDFVAAIGIVMEFTHPEDRPTYLGLANTVPGLAAAVAPVLGGSLASLAGYAPTFTAGAVLTCMALWVMHSSVQEPRDTHSAACP
jgi:MFS family permease